MKIPFGVPDAWHEALGAVLDSGWSLVVYGEVGQAGDRYCWLSERGAERSSDAILRAGKDGQPGFRWGGRLGFQHLACGERGNECLFVLFRKETKGVSAGSEACPACRVCDPCPICGGTGAVRIRGVG